jgi:hypothetical protein
MPQLIYLLESSVDESLMGLRAKALDCAASIGASPSLLLALTATDERGGMQPTRSIPPSSLPTLRDS